MMPSEPTDIFNQLRCVAKNGARLSGGADLAQENVQLAASYNRLLDYSVHRMGAMEKKLGRIVDVLERMEAKLKDLEDSKNRFERAVGMDQEPYKMDVDETIIEPQW
jgi:hypothetical protein